MNDTWQDSIELPDDNDWQDTIELDDNGYVNQPTNDDFQEDVEHRHIHIYGKHQEDKIMKTIKRMLAALAVVSLATLIIMIIMAIVFIAMMFVALFTIIFQEVKKLK